MNATQANSNDKKKQTIEEQIQEVAVDQEQAQRMLRAFEQWNVLREYATKERKRISEKLAARIAQFNTAMEVGHSTASDQLLKLQVVEARWQELEETRDERKEMNSTLRDQIKSAEQKIKDLIDEAKSNQLSLFSESAEPADDDGDEDAE